MRQLSRETSSVLKTLRDSRKSMIVTHFGDPVALLTPVLDQYGSPAPPIESPAVNYESDEFTDTERAVIRAIDGGAKTAEQIRRITELDVHDLMVTLAKCEIKGAIVRKFWGYQLRN